MKNNDIKIIYVHLDYSSYPFSKDFFSDANVYSSLPEYAKTSINQTKKFYSDVVLLTSNDFKFEIEQFYIFCKNRYPSFCKNPFWFFTLARLYSVYLYLVTNKIDKFIHLEYDNLIYQDDKCFSSLPPNIYFTKVGPKIGSAGFMFGNDLQKTILFFEKLFETLNQGELFLANEIKSNHLYEMEMIDYLYTKQFCKYLPLFMNDEYFLECQTVFDGASYGQYLGGTNAGDPKGWYGLHHYVGQMIFDNKIKVEFDKNPWVTQEAYTAPIYNLHIHNKGVIENFL